MATLNFPKYDYFRLLVKIVIVALLYMVTAWLGNLTVLPLSNAPIFWPASGLALVAILVWGWQMSAGILFGSFLFSLQAVNGPNAIPIAATTAVGATLQAGISAFILYRFVGIPPLTIRTILYSLISMAVSAWIIPLIGFISLAIYGYAPFATGWLWWIGVYIGMLAVTPAGVFFNKNKRQGGEEPLVWPVASFMIGVTLFTFGLAWNNEDQQLSLNLRRDTSEMVHIINDYVRKNEEALLSVSSLFTTSQKVEHDEFSNFVTPILQRTPTLKAIAWLPRVTSKNRIPFEKNLQTAGLPNFLIFERDANGQRMPLADRLEYFPFTFVEPFAANQESIGFDIGSQNNLLQTLWKVRDTSESFLSLNTPTTNDKKDTILITAVYSSKQIDSTTARQENLRGYLYGAFQLNNLVDIALTEINPHDIELYVFDTTDPSPQFLAFHPSLSGAQTLPAGITPTLAKLEDGQFYSFLQNAYGRNWKIIARPGTNYLIETRGWSAWISLGIGILSVLIFLLYMESRQRAEEKLRRSDAQYRMISENTADVIWMLDLETQRFTYASPSVEKLRGFTPAEVLSQTMEQSLTPDSYAKVVSHLAQRPAVLGMTYFDEIDQLHKNGSIINTEITSSYAINELGHLQIVGISRDITKRKKAEELIKQSQASLEMAQELAHLGNWELDPVTGIGTWSKEMFRLFRRDPNNGIPMLNDFLALVHPEDRLALLAAQTRAIETDEQITIEYRAAPTLLLEGFRYFEARMHPVKDEQKQIVRMTGTVLDITERKRAEARLHRLNRTYALLSKVNETIVRAREPQKLFETACRVAVEQGEFRMAWIGLIDPQTKEVKPVAHAGTVEDYLEKIYVVLDDSEYGHGPTATALRAGKHRIANDIEADPYMGPWRADALKLGYRSSAAFPLMVAGNIRGALNLYASDSGFFDDTELKLLDEMANDIAFALEFIEQEDQRRQAEENLRANEHRNKMLLRAIPDLMFRVTDEGIILDYSANETDKLYAPPEAFMGKNIYDVLPPPVAAQCHNAIQQAFETKNLQTFEYELVMNNEQMIFEARIDTNPAEKEAVVIVRDITKARRTLQQVRELSRVVEQMDDSVVITDVNGIIEYINPAFERLLGYTPAEALGKTPRILKSGRESRAFYERLWATILRGESFQAEICNRRKNGELIYEAKTITPIRNDQGIITHFVATGKDITARKQMEHDLKERLKELTCLRQVQYLLDSNPSLDDLCQQTATYLTPAMQFPELAVGRVELDGRVYLSHPIPPSLTNSLTAIITVNKATRGQITVQYIEPRPFIMPEEKNMLDSLAYSIGLWIERREAVNDLAQERNSLARRVDERTADLSRANTELARAVRAKDEFLANMSHELRTPLNAILALSEGLLEQLRGPLNERQQKSLQNIEVSGRHLLSLINDILDLSKVEAGRMELQREIISISEICEASLLFVKEMATKKQLALTFTTNDPQAKINADPKRLKQMLVNLLSNSVKFTETKGRVSLEVNIDDDAGCVHLSVQDTGIGIAPEDMARLFQPFIQLDSSLSRQHEGTGLGLALVQRLAELHGGSITVESEVGKGSLFIISLPYKPPTATEMKTPFIPLTKTNSGISSLHSALVVEDSESAAEQIARYLQEINIHAVIHPQSIGVLEKSSVLNPDVIFLDLQMPQESGWEVLARLKADSHTKDIPVVIVSVVDERKKGLAAGAVEYIVKPITREILQQTLNTITIARESAAHAALILAAQSAPAPTPIQILLAEDNELNIMGIGDYLQDKGYYLAVARNGQEALDLAKEVQPNLILMDIQMPEMDGLEATRRLRTQAAFANTPIIALTALAMPGDKERCLAAGANEYMTKPVRLKALVETIEKLLKK